MSNKIVVVGAGSVGATYAYALMQAGQAREIVLVDQDAERARGEAMDLQQGVAFTRPIVVRAGDYADCADAELVVITAGAKQKPGETRMDLAGRNAGIVRRIVSRVMERPFGGILLLVSNPVDVLTHVAYAASGLPRERVLGSGTVLDSARLRSLLSAHCRVDPRNIHAHVIGEHGDAELVAWSTARIGGIPIRKYCQKCGQCPARPEFEDLLEQVKRAAYEIITRKGATYYAIGLALTQITEAVLRDEHRVLPVSTVLPDFAGVGEVALSLPALVGQGGVERVLELELEPPEHQALLNAARVIRTNYDRVSEALGG